MFVFNTLSRGSEANEYRLNILSFHHLSGGQALSSSPNQLGLGSMDPPTVLFSPHHWHLHSLMRKRKSSLAISTGDHKW